MSVAVEVAGRALSVIDNEPIRRQVEVELQSVRVVIDRCEQEIVRHETLDLPAFRQWMAVQCSDLLNERHLIEEKIWGLRARLSTVRGLTQHGIRNEAEAFFWFHEIAAGNSCDSSVRTTCVGGSDDWMVWTTNGARG